MANGNGHSAPATGPARFRKRLVARWPAGPLGGAELGPRLLDLAIAAIDALGFV